MKSYVLYRMVSMTSDLEWPLSRVSRLRTFQSRI